MIAKHPVPFYTPFSLTVDPMKALMLVNIQADPDSVYMGFEPQLFDHPHKGKGMIVLGWRVDGYIDLYHQPGLILDRKNYDIAGKGLADMLERPMPSAHLELTPRGIDMQFAFEDKQGRPISVRVKENTDKARKPFPLLAPFPGSADQASSLTLAMLYGFYFVRRRGTEIEIRIGDRTHQPDKLPVPIDGSPVYFCRYSLDPVILHWNECLNGPLPALETQGVGSVTAQGTIFDVVQNGGRLELAGMRPPDVKHDVRLKFEPAFPNLAAITDGAQVVGRFAIDLEGRAGTITGEYRVQRTGSEMRIEIESSGGWRPRIGKFSVWLMFKLVRIFKHWPAWYTWTACIDGIDRAGEQPPKVRTEWRRHTQS